MAKIEFDDGSTLTIKDETVTAETERLTKVFNYLARSLPRYGAGEPSDDLREQFY